MEQNMPIILLGIVVIGAALGLVYFSTGDRRSAKPRSQDGPRLKPQKEYTTSDDGKVIYAFDKDKAGAKEQAEKDNKEE
jgi:hypothetical protein